jgi:hypothetical protein
MVISSGQHGIVLSLAQVSIHGDAYFDVVIADSRARNDPAARLTARLGPEGIVGDVQPGDTVRVEGFLSVITRIEKVD